MRIVSKVNSKGGRKVPLPDPKRDGRQVVVSFEGPDEGPQVAEVTDERLIGILLRNPHFYPEGEEPPEPEEFASTPASIVEQRKAEKEAEEAEQRYAMAVEAFTRAFGHQPDEIYNTAELEEMLAQPVPVENEEAGEDAAAAALAELLKEEVPATEPPAESPEQGDAGDAGTVAPAAAEEDAAAAKQALNAARERYREAVGTKPFSGWNVDEIERRLAEKLAKQQ